MKTYVEYLQIIKDREDEETKEERENHLKFMQDHPGSYFVSPNLTRMTFDYSVEIMGMMMQDFLREFNDSMPSIQYDAEGRIKVVTE
jgi:hypothetical protein